MFPFHCLLAATVLDSKIRLEFLFLFPWRQCMFFPSSVPSLVFSDLTMECPFMTFFASASLGLCSLLDLQVGVSVNSGCFRPSSHQGWKHSPPFTEAEITPKGNDAFVEELMLSVRSYSAGRVEVQAVSPKPALVGLGPERKRCNSQQPLPYPPPPRRLPGPP